MKRTWFYLDPFQQWQGPLTDTELGRYLSRTDCVVWTDGMPEGVMASELFARAEVVPLFKPAAAPVDAHGQPLARRFNAARRSGRDMDELLGLVRGVILDGEVTDAEARGLQRWLTSRPEIATEWPASVLSQRLERIFADGRVDEEERGELLALLQKVTGERPDLPTAERGATRLPVDDPEPLIPFNGQTFVFTGKFVYGTRAECEKVAVQRGARCASSVSKKVDILVIGAIGSADWIHSTYGRKIEAAVDLRSAGHPISIVSEEHWTGHLRA